MATFSDIMRWKAELDTSNVEAGFQRIKSEGEGALEDVGDAGEGLSSRFSGIGGKMGTALVGGFAAIGVGALLLQGIEEAFARRESLSVVSTRFKLTEQEAEQSGKIAGDLYADAWGESIDQVQDTVGRVIKFLEPASEEAASALAEQALMVQQVWGEDVDAVIRSVSQLMENDLVDSAQHGMDLVVAAFQNGGNEAGDLLDTIDEYSQHFEMMGLSGEEAMNILISGIQNGQRDTDKLADAIKEMRIRAVEDSTAISDAYADLGLDADELRAKFLAGGDDAKSAFLTVVDAINSVEDPVEQNRLAVELIGTQFEDTGLKALEALDDIEGKLGDVEGAAADVSAEIESSDWTKLRREAENTGAAWGDALAKQIIPGLTAGREIAKDIGGWFGAGGDAAEDAVPQIEEMATAWTLVDEAIHDATKAQQEANRTTAAATVEQKAHGNALRISEWELEQLRNQQIETTEVVDEATLRTQAYAEAAEQAARRAEEMNARHSELSDTLSDRQAFLDAEASLKAIGENAEASEQDILNLRGQVADYIAGIDDIPASVLTEVDTLVEAGQYEEALAKLQELEKDRQARIDITTYYRSIGSPSAPTAQPVGGPRAAGGSTLAGWSHQVMERGPELWTDGASTYMMSDRDGRVIPLERAEASAGGGGGPVFQTIIQGSVYGVDHLNALLDERDRQLAGKLRQGRRG